LQRATDIARSMVTEYSMSNSLGLTTCERPRQPMFLPEGFTPSKTYSEKKAAQIDDEVTRVTEEAYQRVQGILSAHRNVLDELAHLLSQEEIVQGRHSERCWAKRLRRLYRRHRYCESQSARQARLLEFLRRRPR
jgi:cell division protease FtsH